MDWPCRFSSDMTFYISHHIKQRMSHSRLFDFNEPVWLHCRAKANSINCLLEKWAVTAICLCSYTVCMHAVSPFWESPHCKLGMFQCPRALKRPRQKLPFSLSLIIVFISSQLWSDTPIPLPCVGLWLFKDFYGVDPWRPADIRDVSTARHGMGLIHSFIETII